ncbi:MAG: 50S ribosomal protein L20 [Elusimicrobiota bacterium]|nr:50S ribosomal protein L20 [Elusimicrobiota bacterium]
MRIKSAVYTRQRKKKYFRFAKGYYSNKKNRWRMVHQQVEKSLTHAYRDRKDKKGNFRKLWISRINSAVRNFGLTYSKFICGLHKAKIELNRKILSEMAINDPETFKDLTEIAKNSLM